MGFASPASTLNLAAGLAEAVTPHRVVHDPDSTTFRAVQTRTNAPSSKGRCPNTGPCPSPWSFDFRTTKASLASTFAV